MVVIKSKSEIELMKAPCHIVKEVLEKLEDFIKPGLTTLDIDKFVENIISSRDALPSFKGYRGYPASICASINEVVVHGIPSDRKIVEGDIISVDVGAFKNGFHGDAARTYAVGKISKEAEDLIRVTKESFFKGIEKAVDGGRLTDISHAVQVHCESHGYGVVRDFFGHGIGREMHEEPAIPNYGKPNRGLRLRAGMVLAVEPMVTAGHYSVKTLKDGWTAVTEDGSLAAHYENTVAITPNGPEILTM
ncbi:type I methionyl aminopeptidase [Seleniivibrio woodruffii]|uniref:Methionine aminopeptidase n=1 Tax=Seleniivibrio woodruffii TaxID=1078050 RepID=A0A4R1KFY6_9BACT|nr:type I methionyl aminopeptidase [Seleniivibrio woodruffii]TCK62229.1 methionyl aminopeptidase [Seleniivibrio woodruffii]TVZ34653.1 methionine aminopeptidase, type I [Seleniivibrio woodruffii]